MTVNSKGPAEVKSIISSWRKTLVPSMDTLRRMAGTTEDEFLQIGSRLQDFYMRSTEINSMANMMVDQVSGEQMKMLVERLKTIVSEIDSYLATARAHGRENTSTLAQILSLLDQVSLPLEGFQKMYKTLRMLSTSTKIESARMGEGGLGFLTLAMDVEKLSHMVSEKSSSILGHRQLLVETISQNLRLISSSEKSQDADMRGVLARTSGNLDELVALNDRCSRAGSLVSSVSCEVSSNISEVVSSMQSHDITRQQVEHIVEALEHLDSDMAQQTERVDIADDLLSKSVIEAGDVCELQEAQLRFASAELKAAVEAIVDNLRDVASKQSLMAGEMRSASGVADSGGSSFFFSMREGLTTMTDVLSRCAQSDLEMSETMKKAASTIAEVSTFVTDIEDIGLEIDLIALNAQIKAAHTGREGAALGVLAEAIKRLSIEAVTRTEQVSSILTGITDSTEHLMREADAEISELGEKISAMELELSTILDQLGSINEEVISLLGNLNDRVLGLTHDIDSATSSIDVHHLTTRMANEVTDDLARIVEQARELEPASTEFKENLRHMEERYTMQSERKIHEAIARKRGVILNVQQEVAAAPSGGDSEFGDNVDLF